VDYKDSTLEQTEEFDFDVPFCQPGAQLAAGAGLTFRSAEHSTDTQSRAKEVKEVESSLISNLPARELRDIRLS